MEVGTQEYLVNDIETVIKYIGEKIGVDYEVTLDNEDSSRGSIVIFELEEEEHLALRNFISKNSLWLEDNKQDDSIRFKLLERRVSYKEALEICSEQGWRLISKNDIDNPKLIELLREKQPKNFIWCKEEAPRKSEWDSMVATHQYAIYFENDKIELCDISPLRLERVIVKIDKNKVNIGDKVVHNNKIKTVTHIVYRVEDLTEIYRLNSEDEWLKRSEFITKEDLR